ncbi:hypothetical protein CVT24_010130 [Panaeolus cyanescens]|uniref:Ecp2 effector protein-like domain-containing protein n=1 Tax=Panaeolus cyanescens TaxID=181874 RepID=A0A409W9L5_9AGAR|nr:hypothetical protein CVT24_010130 [Panaeolus cyanescens]
MVKLSSFGFFVASVLAVASAAPSPNPMPQSKPINYLETRDSVNDCGTSTFDNQTSGASPRVDDCLTIARNIAGGGSWVCYFWFFIIAWALTVLKAVALLAQHQLVQYGTCAFGVQAGFYLGVTNFKVGNSDIIDLINDSVRMFQWNGLVGSKGTMACQSDPSQLPIIVDWGLYHT